MDDLQADSRVITSPQAEYDSLRYVSPEFACPYLPGLLARTESYSIDHLEGARYEALMDRGFRRSGQVVYRPRCRFCTACRPIRVLTDRFSPSRSMRRVRRRNTELAVEIGSPGATSEKLALFRRYLAAKHDDRMDRGAEAFSDFLCDSPTNTLEFRYRLKERMVAVSVADRCPGGISSVYVYFDPDFAARSLGTFSALWEIDYCRSERLPYYYLGYYVEGSRTMAYKARFRPCQILTVEHEWVLFRE